MFGNPALKKEAKKKREQAAQLFDSMDVVISPTDIQRGTKLAAGNYGTVYEGTCRGQPVAIKVLHNQELDTEKLDALKKEVDIMRRLRHPKIMLLMGICVEQGNIALIMEYVQGKDLADVISDVKVTLTLEDKWKIAKDIALGCNWLHCLSPPIIHRDLKPANVMITSSGDVRICDFGLSCIKEVYDPKAPRKTSAVGTPVWMAPEILCGYPNSEKSDMYAYALVIWELFVRREKPFAELDDFPTFCRMLVEDQIRPKFSADVPEAVRDFIEMCWIQDPKKRPYFKEVLELIDDVITDTLIRDPAGRKVWRRVTKKGNKYPFAASWSDFLAALKDVLLKTDQHVSDKLAEYLDKMLAEEQKDVTRSKDKQTKYVKAVKFGEFLDIFGPVTKLPRFEAICKEGAFHGHIDSGEAQKRLKKCDAGVYMLRVSGRENCLVLSIALGPDDPNGTVHIKIPKNSGGGYSLKMGGAVRESDDVLDLIKAAKEEMNLSEGLVEGSFAQQEDTNKGLYDGEDPATPNLIGLIKVPGSVGTATLDKKKTKKGSKREKKDKKDKKEKKRGAGH